MKTSLYLTIAVSLVLILFALATPAAAAPMGTAFTYQGRLIGDNQPANGIYNFRFSLYDAVSGGNQIGNYYDVTGVNVTDGYFAVSLDFGSSAFNGDARWLEICVSIPGQDCTVLSPRVELTPVPYAIYASGGGGGGGSLWQVNGSNIYYNNGNVGIGTTNPQAMLSVGGNGVSTQGIYGYNSTVGIWGEGNYGVFGNGNTYGVFAVAKGTSGFNCGIGAQTQSSSGYAGYFTGGRNYFEGNVGIGTTNPKSKLSVGGDGDSSCTIYGNSSDSGGYAIYGYCSGDNGYGVYGFDNKGNGVYGQSGADGGKGVYGWSYGNNSSGVYGFTDSPSDSYGVYGESWAGAGVYGYSPDNIGVYGVGGVYDFYTDNSSGESYFADKVGIGIDPPSKKLAVSDSSTRNQAIFGQGITGGKVGIVVGKADSYNQSASMSYDITNTRLSFQIAGNDDQIVLNSSGQVSIGTTNPQTYKFYVNGTAYSTGGWQGSDLRFKQNIEKIDSPIDKIKNIKGVSFEWKTSEYKDKGFPEGRHYGVIAQQVEKAVPEIVKEGPDGEKAVAYTELIPILTEAIKEQQKQIESLQSEVKTLKETIKKNQFTKIDKVRK